VVLLTALLTLTACAETANPERTVTATGEGVVEIAPDMATVRLAVVSTAQEADEARRANEAAAARLIEAMRELEIPERLIRAQAIRLHPRWDYDDESGRYREVGFEATREVSITVHELQVLPEVIARAVGEGADRIYSVTYGVRDRDAVREEALRDAAGKARRKAEVLADSYGESLGPVRAIREERFSFPGVPYRLLEDDFAGRGAGGDIVPEAYAPGEIEVTAQIEVEFVLE